MSSVETIPMTMMGKFIWKPIFEYDNTGIITSIEHTYALTQSGMYTPVTFNEFVSSEAKKLVGAGKFRVGASYRPVSVTFVNGHQMSKEVSSFLRVMTVDQKEEITTYTRTEVHKCTIAPKTRVTLYQRVFEAPGMIVHEEMTRLMTTPLTKEVVEEVPLQMMMMTMTFIKGLKVVYSDNPLDAPVDRVRDIFGGIDEMNYMYGGKYVWVVPIMTTVVSEAVTDFELIVTSKVDPNHDDFAKGAGGSYRYLLPMRKTSPLFVTELTLARFSSDVHLLLPTMFWPDVPKGFTTDMNVERGGGYLYAVWKMQRAYIV